ncbi:MAG: M20/M25/M40 family metallo-hydrolase [Chloroflexi bacterium]|nr:M20/M25/M40 family metallo-hydrolase [Chloroflexota bacterium]
MTDMNRDGMAAETVHLLQDLIRIDTSNPPGNESAAADYIASILHQNSIEPVVIEMAPHRGNVVGRIKGNGSEAPLLLYSHTDVVPVEREHWSVDPFGGMLRDGYVYGRGALDMKGIGAMQLAVFLAIRQQLNEQPGRTLQRDIILAATADEETDTDQGIGPLIVRHPDLLRAQYGLSEFGGYTMYASGKCFYPIQAAEKGTVWMHMSATGRPGHASVPHDDNAVVHLTRAVDKLSRARLPMHVSPIARAYMSGLADGLGGAQGAGIRALLSSTDEKGSPLMERVIRDPGLAGELRAITHNTVTPTGLYAGQKTNVIPSSASAVLDCRTVPGFGGAEMIHELKRALGSAGSMISFEIDSESPPIEFTTNTPLYRIISQTLKHHDPYGIPIPAMLTGATDAKHMAKLGTICYGFSPMKFKPGEHFSDMVHGHNERVSIESLAWGVQALYDVVSHFCGLA